MPNVLLFGCGKLGTEIAIKLHLAGLNVVGVRQSSTQLPLGIQTIQADVFDSKTLLLINNIKPNIVIYCLAATVQTDENYQKYYVDGLRNVLETQKLNPHLWRIIFISSTRVYGYSHSDLLNEESIAIPKDFGGKRLLEAEALLNANHLPYTVLRLSGIYGPNRFYLLNLATNPTKWPETNTWTNRIHQTDAAGFVAYMLSRLNIQALETLYLVTDSMPTLQYDILQWLAEAMSVESNRLVPTLQIGKRLSNQRMLSTGYKLQYPTYKNGYLELIEQLKHE
jgi:nucleoside-diphosphate-sugar epimerase